MHAGKHEPCTEEYFFAGMMLHKDDQYLYYVNAGGGVLSKGQIKITILETFIVHDQATKCF
jgi:hypothetical protein